MGSFNLLAAGTGMQALGLALIVGGMLALGAFTAPVIFGQFERVEAGQAMALIFSRFDKLLLGAVGLIVIGEALRFFSGQLPTTGALPMIRYVLLAGLVGLMLFSILKVNSDIMDMTQAGIRADSSPMGLKFARTHQLSENLYKIEMMGAVLILLLTPFIRPAS